MYLGLTHLTISRLVTGWRAFRGSSVTRYVIRPDLVSRRALPAPDLGRAPPRGFRTRVQSPRRYLAAPFRRVMPRPPKPKVTPRRRAAATRRVPIHAVLAEPVAGIPPPPLPSKATLGSACFDLHAAEPATLKFGSVTLVRTGLRLRAPPGTFLEVRPRSGLSSRGVLMVNAPGTIDRDYAGEVKVPLTFLFPGEYQIQSGDRIGQVRVAKEYPTRFETGTVRPNADRKGGFGSTGR